jgi:hypothetical protein
MGLLGSQGGVSFVSAGVEVAVIGSLLMMADSAGGTSSLELSEQSMLSSSSMRWRSGGSSMKANPIYGEDCERGLMLTVNMPVEL